MVSRDVDLAIILFTQYARSQVSCPSRNSFLIGASPSNNQTRASPQFPRLFAPSTASFGVSHLRSISRYACSTTLNPLTSNSDTVQKDWLIKQPLLHSLAEFCSERFEWSDEQILKKKFKNGIWEGALLQMLFSVSIQLVSE